MKCRIPGRDRQLDPKSRGLIRRQLGDCAELTIAEVFGYGNKRISELRRDVQNMYDYYDPRYPDTLEYTRALLALFGQKEDVYPIRRGSGEKILFGREHDIIYLCYAYQLHRRGFGQDRINRFQSELCTRIRYYNKTFTGDYGSVVPVIENRLAQRGIAVGGDMT